MSKGNELVFIATNIYEKIRIVWLMIQNDMSKLPWVTLIKCLLGQIYTMVHVLASDLVGPNSLRELTST